MYTRRINGTKVMAVTIIMLTTYLPVRIILHGIIIRGYNKCLYTE